MKKLILFEGDIETQGYFSRQMQKELLRLGYEVYLYDLKKPWKSKGEMLRFLEKGEPQPGCDGLCRPAAPAVCRRRRRAARLTAPQFGRP